MTGPPTAGAPPAVAEAAERPPASSARPGHRPPGQHRWRRARVRRRVRPMPVPAVRSTAVERPRRAARPEEVQEAAPAAVPQPGRPPTKGPAARPALASGGCPTRRSGLARPTLVRAPPRPRARPMPEPRWAAQQEGRALTTGWPEPPERPGPPAAEAER